MASFRIVFFREHEGNVPFLDWFSDLSDKARDKVLVRLERLVEMGPRLRRPEAGYLGNSIYELRIKHLGVNHRVLYFFHKRSAVVISHGFFKQRAKVPAIEWQRASSRRQAFRENPTAHTHEE